MADRLLFQCEVCGKKFEPNADSVLECGTSFTVKDEETGETYTVDPQSVPELSEAVAQDPELQAFSKGTICMCPECQSKFLSPE